MKQRNPWLDTLKAFAIYLVILGHIINNCIINGYESRLCGILYFTHVPLFLVISGMLVKDKPINTNFLLNLLLRFVVPLHNVVSHINNFLFRTQTSIL